jgi:hypothetical protein
VDRRLLLVVLVLVLVLLLKLLLVLEMLLGCQGHLILLKPHDCVLGRLRHGILFPQGCREARPGPGQLPRGQS